MKKFVSYFLVVTIAYSLFLPTFKVSALSLNTNEKSIEIPSEQEIIKNITEVPSDEEFVRNWNVIDENGIEHTVSINYTSMELTIDDEIVQLNVEEPILMTRAAVDYSTGITISGKIPWKGSVTLLAAAITGFVSGSSEAAGWAATIAGIITADAENIYFSMVQYQSKERYWSSYSNVYYRKAINKNITFYESSLNGKVLCGPVDGSWFDPIRPR